jgi:hypothetical protein
MFRPMLADNSIDRAKDIPESEVFIRQTHVLMPEKVL